MKKITALLMALCCLCGLTACVQTSDLTNLPMHINPRSQTYVVHTHYDYAMHRPEKATLLYNSCTPFFSLPEGLDYAIAGDVFTLRYTGEMMILDSYPGHAQIRDGELLTVTVQKAVILPLTYHTAEDDREAFFTASENEGETQVTLSQCPEYVITDLAEGSFVPLAQIADGTLLYATYSPVDGIAEDGYQIAALYTENPRG